MQGRQLFRAGVGIACEVWRKIPLSFAILYVAGLVFSLTGTTHLSAQDLIVPHYFSDAEGLNPNSLASSGNALYGTLDYGGPAEFGAIFTVTTNGTGYKNIYTFTTPDSSTSTNRDGTYPEAGLLAVGDMLCGTATTGGSGKAGTVFVVKTDGTDFHVLHYFSELDPVTYTNRDGSYPSSTLILVSSNLYGTTIDGGDSGFGTLFKVTTNGLGFSVLHHFTGSAGGANPRAGLAYLEGRLYGTTPMGGTDGFGMVFALNLDGTGYRNLYSFTGGADGSYAYDGVLTLGNTLYGTTFYGGTNGNGAVFAIGTNGANFRVVHNFSAVLYDLDTGNFTNSDGMNPVKGLVLANGQLCGVTESGGSANGGTVFALNPDGSDFKVLHSFTYVNPSQGDTNSDGFSPYAGLLALGGSLYGTTVLGGTNGDGTIFEVELNSTVQPSLNISSDGTRVILIWPGTDTGFMLQSSPHLPDAAWSTVTPAPVLVNGLNVVTNLITGNQMFYRLVH